MGRDVGGHAHGDARGAVQEQVGHLGRQHRRLCHGAVIIGQEIDRFLVQVVQKLIGQPGQADLGVTHGRRRVAVDRTEVALAVDQGLAHGKVLGHADQGVVNGLIAVGVVLADDVADDPGRFLVGFVVGVAQLLHGEQDAAVDRLEAVPDLGQGPADDDAHGVIKVGALDLLLDGCLDLSRFRGGRSRLFLPRGGSFSGPFRRPARGRGSMFKTTRYYQNLPRTQEIWHSRPAGRPAGGGLDKRPSSD